jgi:hypothetical protein
MSDTRLGEVVKQIEKNPNPAMIALGELLLRMGENSFISIGKAVDELMLRGRIDGLPHHVTVMLKGEAEGLTIHVSWEDLEIAERNLIGYCEMRKYAQRSDSWFGIVLDPRDGSIRFGVHAKSPWKQNARLDELTKKMRRSSPAGELQRLIAGPKKKMGRNDHCDCGSGKKSKHCCYA